MDKHRLRQGILILSAVAVLVAVIIIIAMSDYKAKESFKVGLIITGKTTDSGWNGAHYNGVVDACGKLGTVLTVKENVTEGDGSCADAIHELVKEGAKMIILSSYSYPAEAKDVIDSYPDIAFYGISSEYTSANLTSYFGRMYQARYLAGIIAGMQTKSGSVGYVAAMSNSEVNRGINAFALGVRSVNPAATVYVSWTGSWDDSEKETAAANRLIADKGADVVTYHQNQHYTAQAADKAGVYSIGYNQTAEGLSDKYLTAAVWDWASLYYQIIREYVQGQPNSVERHWFGIESGAVGLSELSPLVSDDAKQAVEAAKSKLGSIDDVFSGIIYDSNGGLRCGEEEFLSDETLLSNMNWFVEGVEIYE